MDMIIKNIRIVKGIQVCHVSEYGASNRYSKTACAHREPVYDWLEQ